MTPEQPNANPEAILADLLRRRAELNTAIKTICMIYSLPVPSDADLPTGGPPSGGGGGGGIAADAYLGMSIPDATKKHLMTVRKKLSTQDIIEALVAGGLPRSSYQTAYGVLRRRELQVGDVVNYKGDWGLQEWFPGYRKPQGGKKKGSDEKPTTSETEETSTDDTDEPTKATA